MIQNLLAILLVLWGIICLVPMGWFTAQWLIDPMNPLRNENWIGFGFGFGPGFIAWLGLPLLSYLGRKQFDLKYMWTLNTPPLLALVLFLTITVASSLAPPMGVIYLIPKNYAGWLSVTYNAQGKPPLPIEQGLHIVKFPESGLIETSTPLVGGDDAYFYYQNDARFPLNTGKELGGGGSVQNISELVTGRISYHFWVSRDTKRDFDLFVKDKPKVIGPFPNYPTVP